MSLDALPTIETPYPSIQPTFDISQYLTNGCESFSNGSVMATIEGNHVFWDCRIRTASATDDDNRRFFQSLPVELRPPVGVIRTAMQGHSAVTIQWHTSGWVYLAEAGSLLSNGVISFEARTIRRAV